MNFKAIIFDMDGTIIDTERIWTEASWHLISTRGITLSTQDQEDLFKSIHGLALPKSCLKIKEVAQLSESVEELVQEKSQAAHALYEKYVRFIPGFAQFHRSLKEHNLRTGIATNASPETAELTDKLLDLKQFFGPHIYHMAHVNYANKPDPAIYLYAACQLGVEPHACIAIEDSTHGVNAAKSAGMYCIGINTAKNRKALESADTIVDHYSEINLNTLLYPSIAPGISARRQEAP